MTLPRVKIGESILREQPRLSDELAMFRDELRLDDCAKWLARQQGTGA